MIRNELMRRLVGGNASAWPARGCALAAVASAAALATSVQAAENPGSAGSCIAAMPVAESQVTRPARGTAAAHLAGAPGCSSVGDGRAVVTFPTQRAARPAVITVSRAIDLDAGRPVAFAKSTDAQGAATIALSASGRPVDPVRLLTPPPVPGVSASGSFRARNMPVANARRTSGFGMREHPILGSVRMHSGVDLAAPYGSPIYATSDGVVGSADWRGGYGLTVQLEHGGGVETRYGHMSRIAVHAGEPVKAGQVIGYVGSTGLSTGPHLHYEVRRNGRAVNPSASLAGQ